MGVLTIWLIRKKFNSEYYYNKAIDAYNNNRTQTAIKLLETAFKLDPSYQPIIYNLGVIHLALKNNQLAKDYFYLALQSNPEDTYALYNLGVLEYEDKNFQFAIDHWLKCLEYSEEIDSDTYYCLGLAYEGLEQLRAALNVYEKTLELDPTHVECMVAAGRLHGQFNNLGKALELYDLALTYDSEQADAHLGLALVHARLQQWEDVARGLKTLQELLPEHPTFLNLAGLVAFKDEHWKDAIEFFEQATEQREDYLAALNNLGFAYEKMGHLKKAIKCFQAVLAHPDFPNGERKQMQAIVRKLRRPEEPLVIVPEETQEPVIASAETPMDILANSDILTTSNMPEMAALEDTSVSEEVASLEAESRVTRETDGSPLDTHEAEGDSTLVAEQGPSPSNTVTEDVATSHEMLNEIPSDSTRIDAEPSEPATIAEESTEALASAVAEEAQDDAEVELKTDESLTVVGVKASPKNVTPKPKKGNQKAEPLADEASATDGTVEFKQAKPKKPKLAKHPKES
jgi:tetratricopeptide (TPR) repeat protein